MAKRNVFLHIGPSPSATPRQDDLAASTTLATAGIVVPSVPAHVLTRADLELRWAHQAAGLRRKDVEGAWSATCRATYKAATQHKADVVLSVPGLVAATKDQADLAVDCLHGMRVHLVVTSAADVDLTPWLDVLDRSSLVHRVQLDPVRTEDLAGCIVALALEVESARVERKIAKWTARRHDLARRLRRDPAA